MVHGANGNGRKLINYYSFTVYDKILRISEQGSEPTMYEQLKPMTWLCNPVIRLEY